MSALKCVFTFLALSFLCTACSDTAIPDPIPEAHAKVPEALPQSIEEVEAPLERLAPPVERFEGLGFDGPVAAIHDPKSDVYLVANLPQSGRPAFVTSVLPDGVVDKVRWIDGSLPEVPLNQPTAMALIRKRLVVSDGQHLRFFERDNGVYRGSVYIPRAYRLADLAAGARGELFVTDQGVKEEGRFGTVFRVNSRGKVSAVAHSSILGRPMGVMTLGSRAWIAAHEPHAFYGLAPDGGLVRGPQPPLDLHLSGLLIAGDQVVLTSLEDKSLYSGPIDGPFVPLSDSVDVSGDLGWDESRGRILVPCAEGDRLELHRLPTRS